MLPMSLQPLLPIYRGIATTNPAVAVQTAQMGDLSSVEPKDRVMLGFALRLSHLMTVGGEKSPFPSFFDEMDPGELVQVLRGSTPEMLGSAAAILSQDSLVAGYLSTAPANAGKDHKELAKAAFCEFDPAGYYHPARAARGILMGIEPEIDDLDWLSYCVRFSVRDADFPYPILRGNLFASALLYISNQYDGSNEDILKAGAAKRIEALNSHFNLPDSEWASLHDFEPLLRSWVRELIRFPHLATEDDLEWLPKRGEERLRTTSTPLEIQALMAVGERHPNSDLRQKAQGSASLLIGKMNGQWDLLLNLPPLSKEALLISLEEAIEKGMHEEIPFRALCLVKSIVSGKNFVEDMGALCRHPNIKVRAKILYLSLQDMPDPLKDLLWRNEKAKLKQIFELQQRKDYSDAVYLLQVFALQGIQEARDWLQALGGSEDVVLRRLAESRLDVLDKQS